MCQCRIYIQIKIGSRNIVNQFIILTSLNNNLNTSKATTDANLTAGLFRCIFQDKHYSYKVSTTIGNQEKRPRCYVRSKLYFVSASAMHNFHECAMFVLRAKQQSGVITISETHLKLNRIQNNCEIAEHAARAGSDQRGQIYIHLKIRSRNMQLAFAPDKLVVSASRDG